MWTAMMQGFKQALELSEALAGVRDCDVHLRRTAAHLDDIFPGDGVMWGRLHLQQRRYESRWGRDATADPDLARDLVLVARDHPAVASYEADPGDRRPRRNSDVASESAWRSTSAYSEVFARRGGLHQLSMVVTMHGVHIETAWVLHRGSRDFRDEEVAIAAVLLPTLSALWQANIGPTLDAGDHALAVRGRLGITMRQAEVLELLVGGATASAIGRVLRISERTVHKHLEHLYAKLEVHDRLAAATEARSLGLVGPAAPVIGMWS